MNDILAEFDRTAQDYVTREQFARLLESGRPLRIKYGVDVTAPQLHIGHAVNLWMMRRLQDMGHKVIFLIGDFTTRIGDPTGRSRVRPVIPIEEIEANAQEFMRQAKLVLRSEHEVLEIRRNAEWYESMPSGDLLRLLSMVTHSRLVSRDMLGSRIEQGQDLYLHEMVYPILQGYDSVALQSDLTIVGSDQLFNEALGRLFQQRFGQEPQVIITTRITPGIDGGAKQSKSLGNYIGLAHSPRDKFGRAMRLPDQLIVDYLTVYTDVSLEVIANIRSRVDGDPMGCKLFLAHELVRRYHGEEVADREEAWFREAFSARHIPDDIPEVAVDGHTHIALDLIRRCLGSGPSNNELRRLCEQGAVRLNDDLLLTAEQAIWVQTGDVLRVGKRKWFRLRTAPSE